MPVYTCQAYGLTRHFIPRDIKPDWDWDHPALHDYKYLLVTVDGYRYAKIPKTTVAYIVIDEDDNGDPIIQRWAIKDFRPCW